MERHLFDRTPSEELRRALDARDDAMLKLPDVLPLLDAPGASFMGRVAHGIANMMAQSLCELSDIDQELLAFAIGKQLDELLTPFDLARGDGNGAMAVTVAHYLLRGTMDQDEG